MKYRYRTCDKLTKCVNQANNPLLTEEGNVACPNQFIHTFKRRCLREFVVAPQTLDRGSTGGLTFSRPDQAFMYISDIMNNVVWIVDRATGTTLDHFGFFSHAGGGFHWLHMVATDSKGNIYTGEVDTGKRVQ